MSMLIAGSLANELLILGLALWESDNLGRELTLRELFILLVGLFSGLNRSERP
jgi:hypothetical protein